MLAGLISYFLIKLLICLNTTFLQHLSIIYIFPNENTFHEKMKLFEGRLIFFFLVFPHIIYNLNLWGVLETENMQYISITVLVKI